MSTRRVVVTGASSGIGRATSRLFAQHGWKVVGVARRADRLAALEAEKNRIQREKDERIAQLEREIQEHNAAAAAKLAELERARNITLQERNEKEARAAADLLASHQQALIEKNQAIAAAQANRNEQIAAEVGSNKNGIGYVGLAYVNAKGIKALPVGGVAPVATLRLQGARIRPQGCLGRGADDAGLDCANAVVAGDR